jgi:hypothetical protein
MPQVIPATEMQQWCSGNCACNKTNCRTLKLTLKIRHKAAGINVTALMKARWQLAWEVGSVCWVLGAGWEPDGATVGMSNRCRSKMTALIGLDTIAMQQQQRWLLTVLEDEG